MKRHSVRWDLVFWCFWLLAMAVAVCQHLGYEIPGLNAIVTLLVPIGFAVALIVFCGNVAAARKSLKTSPHPDPDVAALIDGKIDITEYRRRKETRDA